MVVFCALLVPLLLAGGVLVRVVSGETYVYLYDFSVAALTFGSLGTLILSRRRTHRIGVLFLTLAVAWSVEVLAGSLAVSLRSGGLAVVSMAIRLAAFGGAALTILLFPTGAPPSPRWRVVSAFVAFGIVASSIGVLVTPGPVEDVPTLQNPIGFTTAGVALLQLGFATLVLATFGSVASAVVRFRRARGLERQQLKLFAMAAASSFALIFATNIAFPYQVEHTVLGNLVWGSPVVLIPAAVAAAILRHGLYDIDRVISRTLTYAILTALLIGGYGLVVLGLQATLHPLLGSNDLIVAIATLAMAACFGPVRRRVQGFIDRRFNRARYDAARTVEAFAAHLRQEIDLASLSSELTDVIHRTMAPASVSIWLKES